MKNCRIAFPLLFLITILTSWIIQSPYKPAGFVDKAEIPELSASSFLKGAYQSSLEKYCTSRIPSLTFLLYIKNDIYEALNFGQYHSGFSGNVIQGKDGILFERSYLHSQYMRFPASKMAELANETAQQLAKAEYLLKKRGIPLIVVMAPSKIDFLFNKIPWQWTARYKKGPATARELFPFYEKAFEKNEIPYVNCYSAIADAGQGEWAFPDRGIHWTMYASGICLRKVAEKLHSIDSRIFPLVRLTGRILSRNPEFAENDIASMLNIYPPYNRGRDFFYLPSYEKQNRRLRILFIGDSFMMNLSFNMLLAGYASQDSLILYENHYPDRSAFLKALQHTDAIIFIANSSKFNQRIFIDHANRIIGYLANPSISTE